MWHTLRLRASNMQSNTWSLLPIGRLWRNFSVTSCWPGVGLSAINPRLSYRNLVDVGRGVEICSGSGFWIWTSLSGVGVGSVRRMSAKIVSIEHNFWCILCSVRNQVINQVECHKYDRDGPKLHCHSCVEWSICSLYFVNPEWSEVRPSSISSLSFCSSAVTTCRNLLSNPGCRMALGSPQFHQGDS